MRTSIPKPKAFSLVHPHKEAVESSTPADSPRRDDDDELVPVSATGVVNPWVRLQGWLPLPAWATVSQICMCSDKGTPSTVNVKDGICFGPDGLEVSELRSFAPAQNRIHMVRARDHRS